VTQKHNLDYYCQSTSLTRMSPTSSDLRLFSLLQIS